MIDRTDPAQEPVDQGGTPAQAADSAPEDPQSESALAVLPEGPDRRQEAARLAEQGEFAAAAERYAGIVASAPGDVGALLGLAGTLVALGRYEPAEREIRRALRLTPDSAEVNLQLGITLFKRASYPAAAAALRRTLELDPECMPAHLLLGEALNQMGEPQAAIESLENAIRIEPTAKAFYALGIAHDRAGQPERAGQMYRRSRELNGR
jgi:tetratricopeptide (TPR) repeat protein